MAKLKIIKRYFDVEIDRKMQVGEVIEVTAERAEKLLSLGLCEVLYLPKLKLIEA